MQGKDLQSKRELDTILTMSTSTISHQSNFSETSDGYRLFEQSWIPPNPRASVIILHGYGEHINRYRHVADHLVNREYAVYAYDQLGHGQSDGRRAYADSFDIWRDDLATYIKKVHEQAPERPLFMLAHSMGGCIAAYLLATQTAEDQQALQGVLFSAPALAPGDGLTPMLIKIISILGKLLPKLPTQKADSGTISRDPAVVHAYNDDPLVYHGGVPARTAAEMMRGADIALENAAQIRCPLLIMHGAADRLISPEGSKQLYALAGSDDKVLKLYDDLYHEILNEPEQAEVLSDIVAWIEARLSLTV